MVPLQDFYDSQRGLWHTPRSGLELMVSSAGRCMTMGEWVKADMATIIRQLHETLDAGTAG